MSKRNIENRIEIKKGKETYGVLLGKKMEKKKRTCT
jgi:hypothetical protein